MALNIAIPEGCRIASIGPVTTATLAEYGIKPDIEAAAHTIPSLVEAVAKLK
jgi:uroporphyrinogen III methyltransferase/synthase